MKTSSSSIACSRTSRSRLREAAGRRIRLRSFSPGWSGAASIMLSITGIAASALVIWKVRTIPSRAIAYGGLPAIERPSNGPLPASAR